MLSQSDSSSRRATVIPIVAADMFSVFVRDVFVDAEDRAFRFHCVTGSLDRPVFISMIAAFKRIPQTYTFSNYHRYTRI